MEEGRPSRTAFGAASHRAIHQMFDDPVIFEDPFAVRIMGPDAETRLREVMTPEIAHMRRFMRALIVARSRMAEDTLAEAVERGVGQYVLLGAGLDTFAYRDPHPGVKVFEVDYPATQAWKRDQLRVAGIDIPASLTYAPIDFERETLTEGLARAGVDLAAPAVFAWLGVVPYLTRETIFATCRAVAGFPAGSRIVFDYGEPRDRLPEAVRAFAEMRAKAVADMGEPWISFFDPAELAEELKACGLTHIDDYNGPRLNARYFSGERADGLMCMPTAHVMVAGV